MFSHSQRLLCLVATAVLSCAKPSVPSVPAEVVTTPDASTPPIAATLQTCIAPERPGFSSGVNISEVFPRNTFSQPIDFAVAPGDDATMYIAERPGRIKKATAGGAPTLFFSMPPNTIDARGEGGFLGFAFHPKWNQGTREVYVSYTIAQSGFVNPMKSIIARVRSTDNGATLDASTLQTVLSLDQPFTNHNGGGIRFGPDGFLYIGFGDGGAAGDPLNAGQRTNTWLGKFLRIDVDRRDSGLAYAVPQNNPFVQGGALKEIYATGLRNPWRFSFDLATGDLWAADVGQDRLEEINLITSGGNYGWKIREGNVCYPRGDDSCTRLGLVEPVLTYPHSDGASITGGFVSRDVQTPALLGKYIFGDFTNGNVWVLEDDGRGTRSKRLLGRVGSNELASFGQNTRGEVFLLGLSTGTVWKITPAAAEPPSRFPQKLSATGCVNAANPKLPAQSLVPYSPRSMLWSDGASKERYIALPDNSQMSVLESGDFVFPKGTVLVKHFDVGDTRVESRLYILHSDGVWAGYSYAWNEEQTDAELLPAGEIRTVRGNSWAYPSRSDCNRCHTEAAGYALGLELAQLNHPGQTTQNQLDFLESLKLFEKPLPTPRPAPLADPLGTESLEARARSYLHANCSSCHRPNGGARGNLDLRASTPLAQTGMCNVAPTTDTLGLPDAKILSPGKPQSSVLLARMAATDGRRMPPLASRVVDSAGVSLIESWIRSVSSCDSR